MSEGSSTESVGKPMCSFKSFIVITLNLTCSKGAEIAYKNKYT